MRHQNDLVHAVIELAPGKTAEVHARLDQRGPVPVINCRLVGGDDFEFTMPASSVRSWGA